MGGGGVLNLNNTNEYLSGEMRKSFFKIVLFKYNSHTIN